MDEESEYRLQDVKRQKNGDEMHDAVRNRKFSESTSSTSISKYIQNLQQTSFKINADQIRNEFQDNDIVVQNQYSEGQADISNEVHQLEESGGDAAIANGVSIEITESNVNANDAISVSEIDDQATRSLVLEAVYAAIDKVLHDNPDILQCGKYSFALDDGVVIKNNDDIDNHKEIDAAYKCSICVKTYNSKAVLKVLNN